MSCVYALLDPRTDRVHYVGQTRGNPKRRASLNIAECHNSYNEGKRQWLLELQDIGLRPVLRILEEVTPTQLRARERWWIQEMSRQGEPLTNVVWLPRHKQ